MTAPAETITIHANVEITPEALQTIVANAKQLAGRNEKGHYQVDTADMVSRMISRFLQEKDFATFTREIANYPSIEVDSPEK